MKTQKWQSAWKHRSGSQHENTEVAVSMKTQKWQSAWKHTSGSQHENTKVPVSTKTQRCQSAWKHKSASQHENTKVPVSMKTQKWQSAWKHRKWVNRLFPPAGFIRLFYRSIFTHKEYFFCFQYGVQGQCKRILNRFIHIEARHFLGEQG